MGAGHVTANAARRVLAFFFWRLTGLHRPRARRLASEIVRFRIRVNL